MNSVKDQNVMQPKVNKQVRRRGDLARQRLAAPTGRARRRLDLGDLRLQFLLEATSLSR